MDVILVKRKHDPFQGLWALPGGSVEYEEEPSSAARREFAEETGVQIETPEQFRVYGAPDRDPRGHFVTVSFYNDLPTREEPYGGSDAEEAKWFSMDSLPELAFDHEKIVKDFTSYYFGKQ